MKKIGDRKCIHKFRYLGIVDSKKPRHFNVNMSCELCDKKFVFENCYLSWFDLPGPPKIEDGKLKGTIIMKITQEHE